jgi:hypothetical protein
MTVKFYATPPLIDSLLWKAKKEATGSAKLVFFFFSLCLLAIQAIIGRAQ